MTPVVLLLDTGQALGDLNRLRYLPRDQLPVDPDALRRAARNLRGAAYAATITAERLEHRAHHPTEGTP